MCIFRISIRNSGNKFRIILLVWVMVRAILGYNVIVNMFTALSAAVLTEERTVLAIVKNLTLMSVITNYFKYSLKKNLSRGCQ